jgi:glutaredoxin
MAKELLSHKGIPFTAVNVAEDPAGLEAMKQKSGGRLATPTIVIGNQVLVGFNREKLEAMLG